MQTPDDVCPAPAVRQLVWLGVLQSRERWAHGTQNEQMWFLVTQPFLSFDLVGSLPQIPSQTQIRCHTCTQSECASSLPARLRIRLRQCHSIGSERLGADRTARCNQQQDRPIRIDARQSHECSNLYETSYKLCVGVGFVRRPISFLAEYTVLPLTSWK